MRIVIEDKLTPSTDLFEVGTLISTERGNLVLCTATNGASRDRFGGIVLRSTTGLRAGKFYDGMLKEGAKLFTGTVTLSNEV